MWGFRLPIRVSLADGGRMWEGLAEFSVPDGERDGANPAMEGLAQFVHGEFFNAQEYQRIGVRWHVT